MSDSAQPASSAAPSSTTPKPRRPRADFDQKLANDIASAESLINAALNDPAVLAELSYDLAEINAGKALQKAAQTTFNTRQQKVGDAAEKQESRDQALEAVKKGFKKFRTAVSTSGLPESAHTPLGLKGRVPVDLQKLITVLRGAYKAAQGPAYLPALEKRKFSAAKLAVLAEEVEELDEKDGAFKAAEAGSTAATKARDQAGKAMRDWVAGFRKQAKSDLEDHPELRAKLAL